MIVLCASYRVEAWTLLLDNELDQTKISKFVIRKLKGHEENKNNIQNAHNFIKDGKIVANMSWTKKYITVKLSAKTLNLAQEKKLNEFLEKLVKGEFSEV